jgi:hypothetical protein
MERAPKQRDGLNIERDAQQKLPPKKVLRAIPAQKILADLEDADADTRIIYPEESRRVEEGHNVMQHVHTRFENDARILEEMGKPASFEEALAHIPTHFDTSVLSQKTLEYLKNAYSQTQYWDPRLINGLGECGVHMDLERTIKPMILVNQEMEGCNRSFTLTIPQAVQLLKAYAGNKVSGG